MRIVSVANHEQKYSVRENGDVISKWNNNVLIPRVNRNGYLIVTLDKEQLTVHRIVALHFLPNPYGYKYVNHINGNKHFNSVENLEWCTAEYNNNHALETGLRGGFVPYDTKVALVHRAIQGELIADLVNELPTTHPNTLSRMLRVVAAKEGLQDAWKDAMKTRRKNAALRNLEKINNMYT